MFQSSVLRKGAVSWPSWLRKGWLEGPRKVVGRAKRKLLWGLKTSPLLKAVKDRANTTLARFRRPRLRNVTFIGVTGSCAKTTTCIFTKAVLLPYGTYQKGSHQNAAEALLTVDPSAGYHVQELSADVPGKIAQSLALLQPRIGIVTVIGEDHYKNYRSREATSREKGLLIEGLPKAGIAILNADDPHVLAMASRTAAHVITYGLSPEAEVRAARVSSIWPDPLELTVKHGGDCAVVRTRFVGEHWATSVLAALACGIACGLDLRSCAAAIERVDPLFGRYSVHRTPLGASYVLDTIKSSYWTIASGLDFVKKANAARKTVVIGAISDYPGPASRRYRRVARDALEVADRVAFVGPHSAYVDKLRRGGEQDRLFTFMTSFQASAFLAESVADELIYVKGSQRTDHLERLMLAQHDQVVCWRERCGVKGACPKCLHYRTPKRPPLGLSPNELVVGLGTA